MRLREPRGALTDEQDMIGPVGHQLGHFRRRLHPFDGRHRTGAPSWPMPHRPALFSGALLVWAPTIPASTVGFVPGMTKLLKEPWPVILAVRLHATIPSKRSKLVPINARYPIDDVIDAANDYYETKGRRVSLEWTLISGENDSDEEAIGLARIARKIHAHVNIIALNPTPLSHDKPPSRDHIRRFIGTLKREGANVTLRDTRGQDIDAACGQLRLRADSS